MKKEEKESKWCKYLKDNGHKFLVWFVFFFVTALLIILAVKVIDNIGGKVSSSRNTVEEVKVYFQKSAPDSLLNVLKADIDEIQRTLEAMQQDSISVSVKKITR